MEIRQNLTNRNYNPRGTDPTWIVVHNTANQTSGEGTAYNNTKYFKDEYRASSAHYFIDDGDVIWQCVRDTDTAWHVGDGASRNGCYNTNAIGIEVCEPDNGKFTDHEIVLLGELVRFLMDKYGIPAERVCRHHDVTGKWCPWYYSYDDDRWADLKARILSTETRRSDYPMEFILHPDDSGRLFYVNGSDITYIPHPDGVKAIDKIADEIGTEVPYVAIGSKDAPYGFRFFQACGKEDLYHEMIA